ncbi:GspS/AspS pilotin family protein [Photobacterium makurazakiensis]|uniref:type II secretion system pilot lipoprotein GspS-beta n=1 Tax=Photobacterium makurazakiensis TaxID=2910234 RepID=UPI003D101C06
MLKRTMACLTLLLMVGCASNAQDDAIRALADSRAAAINNRAPYDMIDEYKIMKAQAREKTVEITILYGGGGKTPPTQAAKSAAISYCNSAELSPLVSEGVNYNIVIMDMRGRTMAQEIVHSEFCAEMAN